LLDADRLGLGQEQGSLRQKPEPDYPDFTQVVKQQELHRMLLEKQKLAGTTINYAISLMLFLMTWSKQKKR
jgi:hypothetical protein